MRIIDRRTSISATRLDIPDRLGLDEVGYLSKVVPVPGRDGAMFVAYKGAAPRCVMVTADGDHVVIGNVRGVIRAAVSEGEHSIWLLTTHGLQLIDLGALTVIETIRAGVPKYPLHLQRVDDDRLIVSKLGGATATVISTREGRVVDRVRMPTVDLVLRAGCLTLCSFEQATARCVDASLRRAGSDRPLTRAITPVPTDQGILAVLADLVPIHPGLPNLKPQSGGEVGLFDADLVLRGRRALDGVHHLDGETPDGAVLAVVRDHIVLIDPPSLEVAARSPSLSQWVTGAGVAAGVGFALGAEGRNPALWRLEWELG